MDSAGDQASPARDPAHAPPNLARRPDPDELERAGARIASIRIRVVNVFDPSIPEEDRFVYRLVNKLHIKSREKLVRRQLLFAEGEPFVKSRLEESERNLRALPFIQEASVVAESAEDGGAAVLVTVQDTWSTRPGVRFGSSGGKSTTGVALSEINFLGRGKIVDFDVTNGIDRTTTKVEYIDPNVLGSRLRLVAVHQNSTDGRGNQVQFGLPFYSLETPRSWQILFVKNIDQLSVYKSGDVLARFDHVHNDYEALYGWSSGLRDGVTIRWFAGYEYQQELYTPRRAIPRGLSSEEIPDSRTTSGPIVEFSWIQSDFIKVKNFTRFSRFEDYNLGLALDLALRVCPKAFGSTANEVDYNFDVSKGFRTSPVGTLLLNGQVVGRAGVIEQAITHFDATHYHVGWPKQTFVLRLSGDYGVHNDASKQFLLGGDTGLRGFEARRFDGDRRVLLNVEDRIRGDRQIFRLLQLGVAFFVDAGNAWGGPGNEGFGNVKADVGVALLADVVRAAHASFVRLNLAYPLNGREYGQATVLFSFGKQGGFE